MTLAQLLLRFAEGLDIGQQLAELLGLGEFDQFDLLLEQDQLGFVGNLLPVIPGVFLGQFDQPRPRVFFPASRELVERAELRHHGFGVGLAGGLEFENPLGHVHNRSLIGRPRLNGLGLALEVFQVLDQFLQR